MKKSTLIAQCLVNSGMALTLVGGEREVERVFHKEFPDGDFDTWNSHVNDDAANDIIRNVGAATRIRVGDFIRDVWRMR